MSRVGVIAKKMGMSAIFNASGSRIPVTVLKVDNCCVVDRKERARNGYDALQVGVSDFKNISKVSKPLQGHFKKNNVSPKRKLAEFRVAEDALLEIGTRIDVDHYVPNQFVDVVGTSIGKGFAGVMKRHNFGGLRASHGVSVSHRSHGSVGQCQDPGRIFKGKKMAGHMGDVQVTMQNLRVISVDEETSTILVQGCVPGSKNSYVLVSDSIKKALPEGAPYPALKKGTDVCVVSEVVAGDSMGAEVEAEAAEKERE